ncbi:hypothetical protein CKA32_002867 [Geitlerinema sp. FC II]|nr:hypothetical protein CKA32_002867 [Geitlerinema sp. FC II]
MNRKFTLDLAVLPRSTPYNHRFSGAIARERHRLPCSPNSKRGGSNPPLNERSPNEQLLEHCPLTPNEL